MDKKKIEIELHKSLYYDLGGGEVTANLTFPMPKYKPWYDEADEILEECLNKLGNLVKKMREDSE